MLNNTIHVSHVYRNDPDSRTYDDMSVFYDSYPYLVRCLEGSILTGDIQVDTINITKYPSGIPLILFNPASNVLKADVVNLEPFHIISFGIDGNVSLLSIIDSTKPAYIVYLVIDDGHSSLKIQEVNETSSHS